MAPSRKPAAFAIPISGLRQAASFQQFVGLRRQCSLDANHSTKRISTPCNSAAVPVTHFEVMADEGFTTKVKRNENLAKLAAGYLFPEIARRRTEYLKRNPDAKIISLGIGDTTEPIVPYVSAAMQKASQGLGTLEGYSGYGAEQGMSVLRKKIADTWYAGCNIKDQEIFVSDGSKCDIARLQLIFGPNVSVAVQDPSYPVYVDSSVMIGSTGGFDTSRMQYQNIRYLTCTPENNFFPDFSKEERTDVIFFCSPNNPTGAVATRAQLEQLVDFATKNGSIVVYDAAYSSYIKDSSLPKTIFEIPGARQCCLETNSFSKVAGFTGVRLGWTVIPDELKFADGFPVRNDWNRVMTTCFNGASNVAQYGGLACLDPEGYAQVQEQVSFYRENAAILRKSFQDLGFDVYGGENAPYVWVRFPGKKSWDVFTELLENANVVCTPGSGFGPAGEGFIRFSAFGHRDNVLEAVERVKKFVADR